VKSLRGTQFRIWATQRLKEYIVKGFTLDDELTKEFFAIVQNKMHYAVHGYTAAEIVAKRADSKKPLMGLTSFKGNYITSQDAKIAKNYLTEKELNQLNLIVSMYLDFAELQAVNGRMMKMADWIEKFNNKEVERCYAISFDYDNWEYRVNNEKPKKFPASGISSIKIEIGED
jgi:hypothetical protein